MKPGDLLFLLAITGGGIWAGEAFWDLPGAIAGGLTGLVAGVGVFVLGLRVMVATPVLIGTVAGALLGSSIVRALCLPETCHSSEILAAILTGLGSFVGVGLVVALVTRSFDEFREANKGHNASGS